MPKATRWDAANMPKATRRKAVKHNQADISKEAHVKEIRVAAVQMASVLGAPRENAKRMGRWLERAAESGAALAFFPECSLTGYTVDLAGEAAVCIDDEAARELEERAAACGIAVGYGLAERDPETGLLHITYVVSAPDGRLVYRKTHIGALESRAFAPGNELPVATVAGVQVGVQLCWEGHIPDIATTLRAKGAQLVLAPHAGGLGGVRRVESWGRYLPARALDNGLFVIACNALWPVWGEGLLTGREDETFSRKGADGGMAAFGPDGRLIGSYSDPGEHMLLVEVGGTLPREKPGGGMLGISYFDRRRPELYA